MIRKVTALGCPWHGLVRNGQLQLPNEETMPWPQYSGLESLAWREGKCMMQRMPWAQTPERTVDQQAADAASGLQWADYFLIANNGRLHGKDIGSSSWVYACPQGKPWLVTLGGERKDWTLTARLFGHSRSRSEASTHYSMIDDGQSEPDIDGLLFADWDLVDVASHGGRAIVMLWTDLNDHAGDKARALGWLEVIISGSPLTGDFSFQVQVLRTRAQTLGTYRRTGTQKSVSWEVWASTEVTTHTDTRPPTGCGGTSSVRVDKTAIQPVDPSMDGVTIGIVEDGWTDHLDDIVVGMLYDEADIAQPILLDFSYRMERNYPPPQSTVEGYYYRSYRYETLPNGACGMFLTGENEWTLSFDHHPSMLQRWEYTLKHGTRTVTRFMQEESGDHYTVRDSSALDHDYDFVWTKWVRWTTPAGTEYFEMNAKQEGPWASNPPPTPIGPTWTAATGRDRYNAPDGYIWPAGTGDNAVIRTYRLSNAIFGLGFAVNPAGTWGWNGTEEVTLLTPGGLESFTASTGDIRNALTRRGTYNPATGQSVLFTDDTVSYT